MKLNDIPECERCCGVDIDQLESDLKTAQEMIRELAGALEFYGDMNSYREKYYPDHQTQEKLGIPVFYEDLMGKRARAVLSKHAEFLKKIGGE